MFDAYPVPVEEFGAVVDVEAGCDGLPYRDEVVCGPGRVRWVATEWATSMIRVTPSCWWGLSKPG